MSRVTLGELEQEGVRLWMSLPAGAVVWLSGDLGAGKTTLVQAIVRAAAAGHARSPTFALMHEYDSAEGPLVHVDCYRLRTPADAIDLDLDAVASRARLMMIEWPERAGPHVPVPDMRIRLAHTEGRDTRDLEISR